MEKSITQRTMSADSVFGRRFMDSKSLYLYRFNKLPSIHLIRWINGEKAYAAFKEKYASIIESEHQYRFYDRKRKNYEFDETILLLKGDRIVEFNEGYCEILHDGSDTDFVLECTELVRQFKERQKKKPLEINLIISAGNGFELKSMEIKRTKLDLDLLYNDDFKEVDEIISRRIGKKKDKGIVLLHGLPGTGKTTYLRYLIGRIRKRVLFLSPNVAGNMMNPEFIDLLIDNPNTVLIIEDAENIIRDRSLSDGSAVSNLLNISDGLMADFLNVQLICTFNSPLTMVDKALMRKGRLIAKYEFGRLDVVKAQRLSEHLGFQHKIEKPMTVAEICNQNEKEFKIKEIHTIGFKSRMLEN
ncbi:MAG: AAA family ATPase [Flavisolibacter sp.]